MKKKYGKKFLKYCPFGLYDTDCLQMWLEKCAAKGIFLTGSVEVLPGIMMMEYREPEVCRYRIISGLSRTQDDSDMYRMIEESGWKCVSAGGAGYGILSGGFWGIRIYCTTRSDAPELHSDPDLQAAETRRVKKFNFAVLFPFFLLSMLSFFGRLHMLTNISVADVIALGYVCLLLILPLVVQWRAMSIQEKRLKDGRKTDKKYYYTVLVRRQIYRACLLGYLVICICSIAVLLRAEIIHYDREIDMLKDILRQQ